MTPTTDRITQAMNFASAEMPTAKEQFALTSMLLEMQRENEPEGVIVRALVAAVYDGLAYGNWPGRKP